MLLQDQSLGLRICGGAVPTMHTNNEQSKCRSCLGSKREARANANGSAPWPSSKPNLAEACSDTWLSRTGTCAWNVRHSCPHPLQSGVNQVGVPSHTHQYALPWLEKKLTLFAYKNKPHMTANVCAFILVLLECTLKGLCHQFRIDWKWYHWIGLG